MPGTYKHPASARACMSCHFWGNLGGPDVPALSSILDLHSHNAASIDALPPKMAGKTWQKKSEKKHARRGDDQLVHMLAHAC